VGEIRLLLCFGQSFWSGKTREEGDKSTSLARVSFIGRGLDSLVCFSVEPLVVYILC